MAVQCTPAYKEKGISRLAFKSSFCPACRQIVCAHKLIRITYHGEGEKLSNLRRLNRNPSKVSGIIFAQIRSFRFSFWEVKKRCVGMAECSRFAVNDSLSDEVHFRKFQLIIAGWSSQGRSLSTDHRRSIACKSACYTTTNPGGQPCEAALFQATGHEERSKKKLWLDAAWDRTSSLAFSFLSFFITRYTDGDSLKEALAAFWFPSATVFTV